MSLRQHYTSELEQLRLQVEMMAVRVGENLDRVVVAIEHGGEAMAIESASVDLEIDAMNVSLTERCYEIIVREQPVASDARLVLSVIRLLNELERISDHAVSICSKSPPPELLDPDSGLHDLLLTMADEVINRFNTARRAFGAMDLGLAEQLASGSPLAEALHARLVRELVQLTGPNAVPLALSVSNVGRSLERICDHTSVVGARLRYLITGDPAHLAAEVR